MSVKVGHGSGSRVVVRESRSRIAGPYTRAERELFLHYTERLAFKIMVAARAVTRGPREYEALLDRLSADLSGVAFVESVTS